MTRSKRSTRVVVPDISRSEITCSQVRGLAIFGTSALSYVFVVSYTIHKYNNPKSHRLIHAQ